MGDRPYNRDAKQRIATDVLWGEAQRARQPTVPGSFIPNGEAIMAQISADNGSGDYDADEVYWDGTDWQTTGDWTFDTGNQGTIKEVNGTPGMPVGVVVAVYAIIDTSDSGVRYMFDAATSTSAPVGGHYVNFGAYYDGTDMTIKPGYIKLGAVGALIPEKTLTLAADRWAYAQFTYTQATDTWAITATLQDSAAEPTRYAISSGIETYKVPIAQIASSVISQHRDGDLVFPTKAFVEMSLEYESTTGKIRLDGDEATPDNGEYYGRQGGSKGWSKPPEVASQSGQTAGYLKDIITYADSAVFNADTDLAINGEVSTDASEVKLYVPLDAVPDWDAGEDVQLLGTESGDNAMLNGIELFDALETITGYDAGETQYLGHVSGVWQMITV